MLTDSNPALTSASCICSISSSASAEPSVLQGTALMAYTRHWRGLCKLEGLIAAHLARQVLLLCSCFACEYPHQNACTLRPCRLLTSYSKPQRQRAKLCSKCCQCCTSVSADQPRAHMTQRLISLMWLYRTQHLLTNPALEPQSNHMHPMSTFLMAPLILPKQAHSCSCRCTATLSSNVAGTVLSRMRYLLQPTTSFMA